MNKEPVVKLLADLVAVPSMNPMGRQRDGRQYSEKELAEFLAVYLRKNGIDVELYDVFSGRPNVTAFVDVKAAETLLLEAHLDTVHADNMTIDPFSPVVRDGKLYGRGSCDTKGSLAAFCQSVISLLQQGRKLQLNVLLLFVSDEEYRFSGASAAVKRGLHASFGISGEPTGLSIVRAHKGVTRWRIRTKGVAAHGAYPQRGKNAIYLMAPVIERLEQHAMALLSSQPNPLLGPPSLNIGVIEGGQVVNVVPDRCWIEIDRRSIPGETTESILLPVKELIKDLPGVEFEPPFLSVSGMEVPVDAPVVKRLSAAAEKVLGTARVEVVPYATDAGVYNRAGIPTVVFGPGDVAQAHTEDEFIDLKDLDRAFRILQNLIGG